MCVALYIMHVLSETAKTHTRACVNVLHKYEERRMDCVWNANSLQRVLAHAFGPERNRWEVVSVGVLHVFSPYVFDALDALIDFFRMAEDS